MTVFNEYKLNQYFKVFHTNISLNQTRINRITNAHTTLEDLLNKDEVIKPLFQNFYLQGSYATHTAIRPQNGNEFDVDTVLLMSLSEDDEPKNIINLIASRLVSYDSYKDKIIIKDRCVRVNYQGDFHMDIVPAKPTDDEHILIPSRKEGDWLEANPAGFIKWCQDINSEADGKFTRVVKFIKYWRDRSVGKDTAPKSILLTTIIGKNIVGKNSDAESLVLTLEKTANNLDSILVDKEPYVENPSLEGENLARDWDKTKYDIFKTKLEKFAIDARSAYDDTDKESTIKKWQDIFGSKDFPGELSERAEMADAIKAGSVLVSSKGILNTASGAPLKEHRFFGE